MIEKEIKILLSKEQYEKIEKVFSWKKKFTQINFYYGDLEKIDENGELTVRVRQNGDNYKLQIKKPVVYDEALDEFIEMLDMKEFINQPVRQLSLGQKMRAEIVATMLHNPKIIFLDEPTIGLDLVAKKKIQDFIRTINKKYNVTIIFTTHDMQDIVSTCERLIIIDKGKKIYDGAVKNVKELCDDVKILRVQNLG